MIPRNWPHPLDSRDPAYVEPPEITEEQERQEEAYAEYLAELDEMSDQLRKGQ